MELDIDKNETIILKKYYRGYKNINKLMRVRGYTSSQAGQVNSYDAFVEEIRCGKNSHEEPWISFNKEGECEVKVGLMFSKIDKEKLGIIIKNMDEFKDKADNERIHIIIIYETMTSDPIAAFKKSPKNIYPRDREIHGITLETFHYDQLLFNPLKHVLQPKIFLLTDPDKKEELRLYLVRDIEKKDMQLVDLCPLIFVERPICTWLGARLGDILLFDNGEIRAVVNEPHALATASKAKVSDD